MAITMVRKNYLPMRRKMKAKIIKKKMREKIRKKIVTVKLKGKVRSLDMSCRQAF